MADSRYDSPYTGSNIDQAYIAISKINAVESQNTIPYIDYNTDKNLILKASKVKYTDLTIVGVSSTGEATDIVKYIAITDYDGTKKEYKLGADISVSATATEQTSSGTVQYIKIDGNEYKIGSNMTYEEASETLKID